MKRQKENGGQRGFTLIEVVVIVVCVAILALMILSMTYSPRSPARLRPSMEQCQMNLMQIGLAFRTWEGDYSNHYPMTVSTNKGGTMQWGAGSNMFRSFQVLSNELNNPQILVCPSDDQQPAIDFAHLGNTNLSYFVGLDADETFPAMPLSGDRNVITNGIAAGSGLAVISTTDVLTWSASMHNQVGNVCLADGSLQTVTSAGLQQLFRKAGTNINRLAIP